MLNTTGFKKNNNDNYSQNSYSKYTCASNWALVLSVEYVKYKSKPPTVLFCIKLIFVSLNV